MRPSADARDTCHDVAGGEQLKSMLRVLASCRQTKTQKMTDVRELKPIGMYP